jgi:hypothetical protein
MVVGILFSVAWVMDDVMRSSERRELADDCMELKAMSSISRLLAGPDLAKDCRDYFKSRSEEDRADDNVRWRKRLDEARAEWRKARETEGQEQSE